MSLPRLGADNELEITNRLADVVCGAWPLPLPIRLGIGNQCHCSTLFRIEDVKNFPILGQFKGEQ